MIGVRHKSDVTLIDNDHVRLLQVLRRRHMQRALNHRAAFRQQLAPVGEKLRIVMLPRAVRFQSSPEKDSHTVRVLPRNSRSSSWCSGRIPCL